MYTVRLLDGKISETFFIINSRKSPFIFIFIWISFPIIHWIFLFLTPIQGTPKILERNLWGKKLLSFTLSVYNSNKKSIISTFFKSIILFRFILLIVNLICYLVQFQEGTGCNTSQSFIWYNISIYIGFVSSIPATNLLSFMNLWLGKEWEVQVLGTWYCQSLNVFFVLNQVFLKACNI